MALNECARAQFVLNDNPRDHCNCPAPERHDAQHSHVVDFRRDDWANSRLVQYEVKPCANVAFQTGKNHGCRPKILRKPERRFPRNRPAYDAHFLLCEKMAVVFGFRHPRRRA